MPQPHLRILEERTWQTELRESCESRGATDETFLRCSTQTSVESNESMDANDAIWFGGPSGVSKEGPNVSQTSAELYDSCGAHGQPLLW